jgi:RimJ/RimL family protein N-acetyltransferase
MAFASSFKVFPVLETDRLILSEIELSEAEEFHRLQRSALDLTDRAPWEYGLETQSLETARASLGFSRKAWEKKSRLRFGVRLKSASGTPQLIGCCELFGIQNQYKAEVGYWLGADYQRKGYMVEALGAVVHHAFGNMEMGRLFAQTSPRNAASIKMLQKVGFREEGVLRRSTLRGKEWDDSVVMALLSTDR